MAEKKEPRKAIDWEAVELHYRSGIRSLKDIGKEYGVSDAGIIKKAKLNGWARDLGAKIRAKADAKVSAAAVSAEVSEQRAANEQAVIEANSDLQYRVRMEAREDVMRLERLVRMLMTEVEAETNDPDLFSKLGELLDESGEDANGKWRQDKRNELYTKVISAAWRIDAAKKLVEMTEKLVKLKFQVFGVSDEEAGETAIETVLKRALQGRKAG